MTPYDLDPYFGITPGPTAPGFMPDAAIWSDLYSTPNGNWTLALYDYYEDNLTGNQLVNWSVDITYGTLATGVFTPSTGLFTDPAGTIAYTGTAVNTVYANPAANTDYSLVVTTPTCASNALTVPVIVGRAITGTSTVANANACEGGNTTLTATLPAPAGNALSHQWKFSSNNGATYTNVTNNATYSGANTATLTITGATAAMNGYLYKDSVYVTACNSFTVSNAATLTVNPLPELNLTANPFTAIYPGQTTTLAVASTTTVPANGYTWYRNGVVVPGATANTLVVDVDGLGEYTVTVADANACGNAVPATITIASAASDIMFIYPSPNTGVFQVRYYSAAGNNSLPRVLNVYDSKGARVYSRTYSIAVPYSRLDVDMSGFQKGIYQVELADRNGNRLKTGRVVIL